MRLNKFLKSGLRIIVFLFQESFSLMKKSLKKEVINGSSPDLALVLFLFFSFCVNFRTRKSIYQIDFYVDGSEVNSVVYYSALSHEIERLIPKKILRH